MKRELLKIEDELKQKIIKLKEEISLLKSKREVAQRELSLVLVSTEESHKKILEYEKTLNELNVLVESYEEEKDELVKLGTETIQYFTQIVIDYKVLIGELEEKIKENTNLLSSLRDEQKLEHEKIVEENEKLSVIKSDLDIYRKRLEKKYEEIIPNQKIIL